MSQARGNVLHLVDSLGLGGTQTILKDYFESRAADPTVHLYALRKVRGQTEIAHPNVVVNPSSSRFSIAPLGELRRLVRSRDVGILHCHLFRAQVFGFLLKALFFPRIALVFHEHGRAVGREGESGLEALMFHWFLRMSWRRVDRFICISEYTRTRLLQMIPRAGAGATVVANPISVHPLKGETQDRAQVRRAEGIPEDAFVVGFASRLVDRKGWADFLDAAAMLRPRLPVFFLVAGDGEDRGKAEKRVRALGIEGHGRMLGHISWMNRFYGCLDCFVMPSHWEPHGLAHLEAQSFGVPVVVSNVPGLASTVRDDNALLFEPGDIAALAACIERLASDPALGARLAAKGVANSARYSMDSFASSLEETYASLGCPGVEPVAGS